MQQQQPGAPDGITGVSGGGIIEVDGFGSRGMLDCGILRLGALDFFGRYINKRGFDGVKRVAGRINYTVQS